MSSAVDIVSRPSWMVSSLPAFSWALYSSSPRDQDTRVLSFSREYTFVWGRLSFCGVVMRPLSVQRGRVIVEVHLPEFCVSVALVVLNEQLAWEPGAFLWARFRSKFFPRRPSAQNFPRPRASSGFLAVFLRLVAAC